MDRTQPYCKVNNKKQEKVWEEDMGIQRYSQREIAVLTPVRGIGTLIWETDRSDDQRSRWSEAKLSARSSLVVHGRHRDIRRFKGFFLPNACHFREFLNWTGTSTTLVNFGKRP